MKAFHNYSAVYSIRGVLTLIAATVVFALPRAAACAYDLPGILLLTFGALPKQSRGRLALKRRVALGTLFVALLFCIV